MALRPPGLVATDLDGTLLDRETYELEAARPAIDALRERSVPLVLVSSKTRAEMEPLAARIGGGHALIVENGGAVLVPAGRVTARPPWVVRGGHAALVLGTDRARLLAALPLVARDAGVPVRSFAAMSVEEVSELTGLSPEQATQAMAREHDEPFVVEGLAGRDPATVARLDQAARARGLRVTHGGRVHHLAGASDKGQALRALLHAWRDELSGDTVGLGDAPNDLPLLQAVARPILMPLPEGEPDPVLAAGLPGAEVAPGPGPGGWAAAILAVLRGERLAGARA